MIKNLLAYIISGKRRTLIIYAVVMLSLGILLFSETGKLSKRALEEQILHRETILVRGETQLIQQYFSEQEKALLLLASNNVFKDTQGKLLESTLKEGMSVLQDPVTDIVRTDKDGNVTARASGLAEVNNVSELSFFIWSKDPGNQGKVYYQTTGGLAREGVEKGKKIIVMITPIWQREKYTGVLAFVLSSNKLGERSIQNLKVSDLTNTFLLDSEGDILSAIIPAGFGDNIFDYIERINWKGKADFLSGMQTAVRGGDGKVISCLRNPDGKLVKYYFAFAPVKLSGGKYTWSLVTSVPENEVILYTWTIYNNHNLILIYLVLTIIGMTIISLSLIRKK